MAVALTFRPFFALLWWVVSIMLFVLLYLCRASVLLYLMVSTFL